MTIRPRGPIRWPDRNKLLPVCRVAQTLVPSRSSLVFRMRARTQPKLDRMRPPVRRVLAIDGGSRRLKLLLAESDFGRFRVLKQDLLDLQAEGLLSEEEIKAHLLQWLQNCGRPPL